MYTKITYLDPAKVWLVQGYLVEQQNPFIQLAFPSYEKALNFKLALEKGKIF